MPTPTLPKAIHRAIIAVHYAETFIVPAAVGLYVVRPTGHQPVQEYAILKAMVRS